MTTSKGWLCDCEDDAERRYVAALPATDTAPEPALFVAVLEPRQMSLLGALPEQGERPAPEPEPCPHGFEYRKGAICSACGIDVDDAVADGNAPSWACRHPRELNHVYPGGRSVLVTCGLCGDVLE